MSDTTTQDAPPIIGSSATVIISRLGERVAKLEANQEALKGDTEHIRQLAHATNNELMKIVVLEERCQAALVGLAEKVNKLVEAAPHMQTAIATFEGMRSDLREVIEARQRQEGQRHTAELLLGFLRTVLPWIVALAGMTLWAWQNLHYIGR